MKYTLSEKDIKTIAIFLYDRIDNYTDIVHPAWAHSVTVEAIEKLIKEHAKGE